MVKEYVDIWTYPENIEVVDELHGYRLCNEASAVTFIVHDLVSCVEQDDILLKVEINHFLLLIEKSCQNACVSETMKDIYCKVTLPPYLPIGSISNNASTVSATSTAPIMSATRTTSAITTKISFSSGSAKGADAVLRQGRRIKKLNLALGRGHGMVRFPSQCRGQGLCLIPSCRSYSQLQVELDLQNVCVSVCLSVCVCVREQILHITLFP